MGYNPNFRGTQAKGSSRQLSTNFQNASGSTLLKSAPVSVNASGQIIVPDVTSQTSIQALVGLAGMDIPNSANGAVVDNGRLEDITTSFAIGDAIYLSKAGGLTNLKPDYGVGGFGEGDFVVFIGVIVKNEFNGSLKDLKLMISVIGQL